MNIDYYYDQITALMGEFEGIGHKAHGISIWQDANEYIALGIGDELERLFEHEFDRFCTLRDQQTEGVA